MRNDNMHPPPPPTTPPSFIHATRVAQNHLFLGGIHGIVWYQTTSKKRHCTCWLILCDEPRGLHLHSSLNEGLASRVAAKKRTKRAISTFEKCTRWRFAYVGETLSSTFQKRRKILNVTWNRVEKWQQLWCTHMKLIMNSQETFQWEMKRTELEVPQFSLLLRTGSLRRLVYRPTHKHENLILLLVF